MQIALPQFVRKNSVNLALVLFKCLSEWAVFHLLCSSHNEDPSFHFDGSGYSVVEKTLRATVTQIIMLFSTFSPNGLLLYLTSNGTVRVFIGHCVCIVRLLLWYLCLTTALWANTDMTGVCVSVCMGMPYYFPIFNNLFINAHLLKNTLKI